MWVLIVTIIGVFILSSMRKVWRYIAVFETLVHETGHAIFVILTRGKMKRIDLYHTTDGLATYYARGKLSQFVVTLMGYIFSSFITFLFVLMYRENMLETILFLAVFVMLIGLLLWVRNFYGIIWILLVCGILYYSATKDIGTLIKVTSTVVVSTMVVESFKSAFTIKRLASLGESAGDCTTLEETTGISQKFWGNIFLLQSVVFIILGFTFGTFYGNIDILEYTGLPLLQEYLEGIL